MYRQDFCLIKDQFLGIILYLPLGITLQFLPIGFARLIDGFYREFIEKSTPDSKSETEKILQNELSNF